MPFLSTGFRRERSKGFYEEGTQLYAFDRDARGTDLRVRRREKRGIRRQPKYGTGYRSARQHRCGRGTGRCRGGQPGAVCERGRHSGSFCSICPCRERQFPGYLLCGSESPAADGKTGECHRRGQRLLSGSLRGLAFPKASL